MTCYPGEHPIGGQLCGADPETIARAAPIVEERGFDLLDLDYSCPTRRILARGWGGEFLKDPAAVARAVAAAVKATRLPVTLKYRSGWDEASINAWDVAKAAEDAGVSALILHGRSVTQAYKGDADWTVIARTKAVARVPVVGAGGIRTPEDALRMRQETGCDAILVARGALGNPWIFKRAAALLEGGPVPPPPTREERLRVMLRHLEATVRYHGERNVASRLTRFFLYYGKDLPGFEEYKRAVQAASGFDGKKEAAKAWFRGARA
jgi:tRNA-dihydrouridine synthase B